MLNMMKLRIEKVSDDSHVIGAAWPVLINFKEYNGVNLVDIRKHYKDKEGEIRPTRKGISLTESQFSSLVDVLASEKDTIKSLYSENKSFLDLQRTHSEFVKFTIENSEVRFEKIHDQSVFSETEDGVLVLNSSIPWVAELEKEDSKTIERVVSFIRCFSKSISLFDDSEGPVRDILDTVTYNLFNYLKRL